jgi:hypothetical protein
MQRLLKHLVYDRSALPRECPVAKMGTQICYRATRPVLIRTIPQRWDGEGLKLCSGGFGHW